MADKNFEISLAELGAKLDLKIFGDGTRLINKVVSPEQADDNALCAVWDERAAHYFTENKNNNKNFAVIAPENLLKACGCDGLICDKPREVMPKLFAIFNDNKNLNLSGVDDRACVALDAMIDESAYVAAFAVIEAGAVIKAGAKIMAGAYIGADCVIGERSVIEPRAVLMSGVKVGKDCLLHSGCVIGCDGFGFVPAADGNGPVKIPQVGGVTICDNVEVGACTTIDRGTLNDTFINDNTKIDNQVQIGHNVKIGKNCIICSMTGIAGSSELGDNVIVSVQAGITDHVKIGSGAVLAARSGVTNDVKPGAVMSGYPLQPHNDAKRSLVLFMRLPELFKRVKELEKKFK
ncbi:MAG: UDP-3-O-(3-hydroxymyristoyl)glucosamine N-acyltransferase [Synergistaceae bacterium]|nr:UDP-3-O-(3-hydroxymyristoyl)glucosamine N-acyltransferase [Synergistaceae bacterium]